MRYTLLRCGCRRSTRETGTSSARWARSWPSRCPVVKQWTNEGRLKYELVWVGNRKPELRYPKAFIDALPHGITPPVLSGVAGPRLEEGQGLAALDALIEERVQQRTTAALDALSERFHRADVERYRKALGKMAEAVMVFAEDPAMTVEDVLRVAAAHMEQQRDGEVAGP